MRSASELYFQTMVERGEGQLRIPVPTLARRLCDWLDEEKPSSLPDALRVEPPLSPQGLYNCCKQAC